MTTTPIRVLVAREAGGALKARAVYQGPLMAPVAAGQRVGALRVWEGSRVVQETPLYTAEAVERGPLPRRALDWTDRRSGFRCLPRRPR